MKIDEVIRKRRLELHMTQRELGEKVGYDNEFVSKWERGVILPSIYILRDLSDALEINIYELLGYEDIVVIKFEKTKEIALYLYTCFANYNFYFDKYDKI